MSQSADARPNEALEREVAERKRAEEALAFLASIVGRGLDLSSVLTAIAETAGMLFKVEVGFRLVEGVELVRAVATPGARAVMVRDRIRIGESVSGQVAASGEPIVTLDVAHDERIIPEHRRSDAPATTAALMCVPVRVGTRTVGTISIYRARNAPFDADAVNRAMSLADHAGIAIESARLYGEAERRRREAEELAQVARTLTESLDTTAVGRRIVDTVLPLFSAQGSGLRLLQPDGSLRGLAWGGPILSYMEQRGDVMPSDSGVSGQAVTRRAPAWSTDITHDPAIRLTDDQRARIEAIGPAIDAGGAAQRQEPGHRRAPHRRPRGPQLLGARDRAAPGVRGSGRARAGKRAARRGGATVDPPAPGASSSPA